MRRVCVLPHATAFAKIASMQKTRQRFGGGRYSRRSGLLWAMRNTYIGQPDVHDEITTSLARVHPRQAHRRTQATRAAKTPRYVFALFVCLCHHDRRRRGLLCSKPRRCCRRRQHRFRTDINGKRHRLMSGVHCAQTPTCISFYFHSRIVFSILECL